MAQKRMFDKTITNSDDFLDMPSSSQNLYFHLSMNADDDGFINNWKSIMRMTGTKEDDLKILIAKQFIIPFDSGVIVIKHWRINNYLRNDRYIETKYKKEKDQLSIDNNLVYQLYTNGIPSIEENSIEENSIEENNNISSKKFEEEFEELWKLYPKKVGKKQSLRHYIRSRKDGIEKETIEEGLKKYIEYINNEKIPMKFIKDGSTWFNQESWNDERTVEHQESEEEWIARMEREIARNESKRN